MFGRSRRLLGLALDEIYLLRGVMADEAMIIKAHLGYKTFPKTRRQIADEQVVRMALFAEGQLRAATRYGFDIVRALRLVEVPQVLTISRWLEQRGLENDKPDQFDSDAHPDTTGSNG